MRHSRDRRSRRARITLRRCVNAHRTDWAPSFPRRPPICADCTIHTPPTMLSGFDTTSFVPGFSALRCRLLPRCYLTCLGLHALYISYFVRSCIRRRFDPLLLHITFLIGSSLYYHPTHRNPRFYSYPYSRPYIGPAFSLFYHFGGTHVDATHAR